jgi:hypothetical protein
VWNCLDFHYWRPIAWTRPQVLNFTAMGIWESPWKNKYYSCC